MIPITVSSVNMMLCVSPVYSKSASIKEMDTFQQTKLKKYLYSNGCTSNNCVDVDYILQNISTSIVEVINEKIEIYGNHEMSDKEFRNLVINGSCKNYLIYRTKRQIDLPYDALLKIKTQDKTYSYENGFSLDNISVSQNKNIGANIS